MSTLLVQGLLSRGLISYGYGPAGLSLVGDSSDFIIEPIKFMGATVIGLDASNGLNENAGAVTIQLVEDFGDGDSFVALSGGEPATIEVGSFRYDGLVQDVSTNQSINGYPTYTVVLQNPLQLLDGVQVIVDGYNQSISGIPNLVNPYGYWETTLGFGGAMTNAGGMPWKQSTFSFNANLSGQINLTGVGFIGLRPALDIIMNNNGYSQLYGQRIQLAGHTYVVDFDSIEANLTIPETYRVPGPSLSLLQVISELYYDSGFDYVVKLTKQAGYGPHTISFTNIDRRTQPNLTAIQTYLDSVSGQVISANYGKEFRNEPTSFYLVGGLIEQLNMMTSGNITPYWGEDVYGQPIIATGVGNFQTVDLNATPIIDIVGYLGMGATYPCNILEMRCALSDYDSWAAYVCRNRYSGVARPLGLATRAAAFDSPVLPFLQDFIADDFETALNFGSGILSPNIMDKGTRLYEFVRSYADEYYGRKYLVQLPFISQLRLEPETSNVVWSEQPASAAYLPEGSTPIGLSYLNQNKFLDQQNKFNAFARYDTITEVDLTSVSPEDTVIQIDLINSSLTATGVYINESLFTKVSVDENIVYAGSPVAVPQAIITMPQPLFNKPETAIGNITDLSTALQVSSGYILNSLLYANDSFPVTVHPAANPPEAVALPTRSNRDRYGPWGYVGTPGKTSFLIDDSLVPWNYGSYTLMDAAADAKISGAVTNLQNYEKASIVVPGFPNYSMGDVLVSGGPNISNISIRIGADGYTTNYEMQTYTPRFGIFARDKAERFQRIGQSLTQMNRTIRDVGIKTKTQEALARGYRGGRMQRMFSKAILQESPHSVLVGHSINYSGQSFFANVSVQKFAESVVNSKPTNTGIFTTTSVMGLDGLLRPFSTNTSAQGIAHYLPTQTGVTFNGGISYQTLHPLPSGNDLQWVSWGDSYSRLNTRKMITNPNNARLMGIKAPTTMVGFGYSVYGHPLPNSVQYTSSGTLPSGLTSGIFIQNNSTSFMDNYAQRSDYWPAGPIDLGFDDIRGVWSPRLPLFGTMVSALAAGSSGQMRLVGNNILTVYDFFGSAVASGKNVVASYDNFRNKWYVTQSAC